MTKRVKDAKKKSSAKKASKAVRGASTVDPSIHLPNPSRNEIVLLERLLAIQEAHYGTDHFMLEGILLELGICYGNLGNDQKKKNLLERVLGIQEHHYGLQHRAVAMTLTRLGDAYRGLGDLQKAQEVLERALAIQETVGCNEVSEFIQHAVTLTRLSVVYQILKNMKKSQMLLERAWGIYELHHRTDQIDAAETLGYLGSVHRALGDPEKGKGFLERALVIEERHYGPNHVAFSATLTNLGAVYQQLKDLEKSQSFLDRALAIKEKHYGLEHVALAATLTNLGGVYRILEKFEKSKVLLKRALMLKERHYGPTHLEVAHTLIQLGFVCYAAGEIESGIDFFKRVEAIQPSADVLNLITSENFYTAPTELVFDLHGYSVEDAKAYILRGLAYAHHVEKIRIITGRGNHINPSGSRGVLYQQLPSWLAASAYQNRIEKMCTYDGYYELHLRVHGSQNQLAQEEKVLFDSLPSNRDGLTSKADEGDPMAQLIVGSRLMERAKTDADFKRAFGYCLKSAKQGHADAMITVANSYMVGRGCRQNDPEAVQWLEKALAADHWHAGLLLGDMYWGGHGVQRDPVKAVFYYEKSAARNHVVAIRKLASVYLTGMGVEHIDKQKSFTLYKKAADLGEVTSQYNVGCMYANGTGVEPDLHLAHQYFLLGAQGGDPDAQFYVGRTYLDGRLGVVDTEQGDYWIHLAAENGNTQALNILQRKATDDVSLLEKSAQAGNIFDKVKLKLKERNLTKNEEVLQQLFKESYRESRDLSDNHIMHLEFRSRCYLLDELLSDKNIDYRKKGIRVLEHMAQEGCIFSIRRLFNVYYKGIGLKADEEKALAYLERGYQLEDAKSTMLLAIVYAIRAKGDTALLGKAMDFYKQAAMLGYPPANYRMGLYCLQRKEIQECILYLKRAIDLEQDQSHVSQFDSGTYDDYGPEIKKDAALRLSTAYFMEGAYRDLRAGFKYVHLAAEWGSEYALEYLEKLKKEGFNELSSQWLDSSDELLEKDFSRTETVADPVEMKLHEATVGVGSGVHANIESELAPVQRIITKYKTTNLGQAFRRAAGFGTVEDLSFILRLAPDVVNQFGLESKKTALHIAVQQNQRENVKFLLEKGADKNLRDGENKTALEYLPAILEKDDQDIITHDEGTSGHSMLFQFKQAEQNKTVSNDEDHSVEDEYSQIKSCRIL